MAYITTTGVKPKISAPRSRVRIRAFNSNGHKWKQDSLTWLNEMRAEGFAVVEAHRARITRNWFDDWWEIFVVEEALAPIPALPERICFNGYEVGAPFGHAVSANADTSPATVKHFNFWNRDGSEESPHFQSMVLPLINELASRLSEEEK